MMHPMLAHCTIGRTLNAVAAGTTDQKSTALETMRSITYIVLLGAITATGTGTVSIQESDTTTDGDFTTLAGPSAQAAWTDADSNKDIVVEADKVTKKYTRVLIDISTANAVLNGVYYIMHDERKKPPTQPSTTIPGT